MARNKGELTQRELEVLTLVGAGKNSQEVANKLFLAKRTVDFHLYNAYRKLGARNRIEALKQIGLIGF
ncbi:MAG: helix-turn-helix transcriptional regulator [Patescibacteria group bacterium]